MHSILKFQPVFKTRLPMDFPIRSVTMRGLRELVDETHSLGGISIGTMSNGISAKREKAQRECSARLGSRKMMRFGLREIMVDFGAAGCVHSLWVQADMRELG